MQGAIVVTLTFAWASVSHFKVLDKVVLFLYDGQGAVGLVFFPMRQSSIFNSAGKFCLTHGLRQLTRY